MTQVVGRGDGDRSSNDHHDNTSAASSRSGMLGLLKRALVFLLAPAALPSQSSMSPWQRRKLLFQRQMMPLHSYIIRSLHQLRMLTRPRSRRSNESPTCVSKIWEHRRKYPEISGRIVSGFNNSGVQRSHTGYQKPRNGANSRDINKADEETGLVGWGGRIRTSEWRNQNPLPYHLATPQHFVV